MIFCAYDTDRECVGTCERSGVCGRIVNKLPETYALVKIPMTDLTSLDVITGTTRIGDEWIRSSDPYKVLAFGLPEDVKVEVNAVTTVTIEVPELEATPYCVASQRHHCKSGTHCGCRQCHNTGTNSKFPDLSGGEH